MIQLLCIILLLQSYFTSSVHNFNLGCLYFPEWTWQWCVLWLWRCSIQTLTCGSRLMPVGSPLDTHGCDWCMLSHYARGINNWITAAFTFTDLLHHLPTPAWITVTNMAIHVLCLPLFSSDNSQSFKKGDLSGLCLWKLWTGKDKYLHNFLPLPFIKILLKFFSWKFYVCSHFVWVKLQNRRYLI